MPSINWCGIISISGRSLQVPGSLSSALHRIYLGLARILGNETPLHAGGKTRAAASAQIRFLDFIDDLLGSQFLKRAFHAFVAIVRDIDFQFVRILHAETVG